MTTGNSEFQLQQGDGWNRGLNNLLRSEFNQWFGTRTWLVQIVVWAMIINLILFFIAVSGDEAGDGLIMLFNIFMGLFAAVGVCIIMQGAVVGEKQTGTAAWILSKPVARQAFLLAKFIGNTIGITVTIILVQGLIAFLILTLIADLSLEPLPFLGGLGVQLVNLLFYITMTLMLGALFDRRGPVIAIPLAFLFSQQFILGLAPDLANVLPWSLVMPPNDGNLPSIAAGVMTGTEPATYLPLATTFAASVVFLLVGLWAFQRQEL